MPGELGAFFHHPGLEVVDERCDQAAANRKAFFSRAAIDLALDIEDRINALDGFERERCDGCKLAAGHGGDVGEHEEFASAVAPTGCFFDWSWPPVRRVKPVEARIGVSLQNARIAFEMTLRMFAGAVARIEEHRSRRSAACEWPIIADVSP